MDVDVADAVRSLGGVVDRAHLLRFVTRAQLDRAVDRGQVEVVRRGRITTPDHDRALAAAARVGGVLCLQSAALARGWSVAERPRRVQVTVPRNRSVATHLGQGLELYRRDVTAEGAVTSAEQTVLDCATHLPLLEAVSVGDSALRSGQVGPGSLRRAAESSARSGRGRRLEVVSLLDGRAANPFESAVRVLASKVEGLDLVPQLHLPGYGRPDLRDPRRRVIVECDSFTHHHDRLALVHDTERYNTAAILGQAMLRFAFEHPFRQPDYVVRVLQSWVDAQDVERDRPCRRCA